jgi:hypothetical protein
MDCRRNEQDLRSLIGGLELKVQETLAEVEAVKTRMAQTNEKTKNCIKHVSESEA